MLLGARTIPSAAKPPDSSIFKSPSCAGRFASKCVSSLHRVSPPHPKFAASVPVLASQLGSIVVLLFGVHPCGFAGLSCCDKGGDHDPGMCMRRGAQLVQQDPTPPWVLLWYPLRISH